MSQPGFEQKDISEREFSYIYWREVLENLSDKIVVDEIDHYFTLLNERDSEIFQLPETLLFYALDINQSDIIEITQNVELCRTVMANLLTDGSYGEEFFTILLNKWSAKIEKSTKIENRNKKIIREAKWFTISLDALGVITDALYNSGIPDGDLILELFLTLGIWGLIDRIRLDSKFRKAGRLLIFKEMIDRALIPPDKRTVFTESHYENLARVVDQNEKDPKSQIVTYIILHFIISSYLDSFSTTEEQIIEAQKLMQKLNRKGSIPKLENISSAQFNLDDEYVNFFLGIETNFDSEVFDADREETDYIDDNMRKRNEYIRRRICYLLNELIN